MTLREAAGLVGLEALLLGIGVAWLVGLGLVRSLRPLLRLAGAALFMGWALLGIVSSIAVTAGAALSLWQLLLFALGLVAGGLALGRLVSPRPLPRALAERGLAAWGAAAGAALLLVYLEALFRRSKLEVTTAPDAIGFWIPKAASLVYRNGITGSIAGWPAFANPDYPPFAPVQDATAFRFAGRADPGVLPLHHWVIGVAFLAAAAGLLAGRVRPLLLWPGLAVLVIMPSFGDLIGSSLGDEPLALLLALAGVAGALWLLELDHRYLVLSGICTTAAALTKVEGLPAALVLAALLAAATGFRFWRLNLPLVVGPVLVVLYWRHWTAANDVHANSAFPYGKLLDPGYLGDRLGRFGTALADVPRYLFAPDQWLLAVPVALLLAALVARRRPPLALLVLGTAVLQFLGLTAIYWISPLPLDWYIQTSAARVVSSTALFCAAIAPLLLSEAIAERD